MTPNKNKYFFLKNIFASSLLFLSIACAPLLAQRPPQDINSPSVDSPAAPPLQEPEKIPPPPPAPAPAMDTSVYRGAYTLAIFLPQIPGYKKKGKSETIDMQMEGKKYALASQVYRKGRKHIKISINDYQGLIDALKPALNMQFDNNDEYHHSDTFKGNPGWIQFNNKRKKYSIGIAIKECLLIIIEGTRGVSETEMRQIADAINYDELIKTYLPETR